ncbi:hypothetical protein EDC96DRAFT_499441 [Choanephora cucurbitarum]|nr:hypothetical protein EDC96DRAFT_499441 [Choanephora cucurbitarum]
MTDMDVDEAEFDHLDLDDLIKLEEEAVVVDHTLMPDRSTQPTSNMSIATSFGHLTEYGHENGQYMNLESEIRNLKHELNRMQRKLQEQDDTVKRKDQEVIGLKQQLSILRQKTTSEKRTFPAQKPMPKKPSKRHLNTQPEMNTMKRVKMISSPSTVASSIPSTPTATTVTIPPPSPKHSVQQDLKEDYIKLLRTLYYDRLYERNKQSYIITKEARLWLTSSTRNQLTDEFLLTWMPKPENMPTDQFGTIIHEIKVILSEPSLPLTLHALTHQINLCLSLANRHQLCVAIKHIVTAIYRLLEQFPSMIRILYLDLVYSPSSSLVLTLVDTLSQLGFRQRSPHAYILSDSHSLSDIKRLKRQYQFSFSEIADRLKMKGVSDESYHSTLFILDILRHLSRNYQKPLFDFLITKNAFLNLLSTDAPLDILIRALSILKNTNFGKSQLTIDNTDEDKPLLIAQKLFDLLDIPSTRIGKEKAYQLHLDVLQVLKQLCKMNLPSSILLVVQRETYKKSMDLMRAETVEMKKLLKKAERRKQAEFIAKCFDTIHTVLKMYKEDLFDFYEQNEAYNLVCISNLVLYMFKQIPESHQAYIYVAAVEKLLNRHVQISS